MLSPWHERLSTYIHIYMLHCGLKHDKTVKKFGAIYYVYTHHYPYDMPCQESQGLKSMASFKSKFAETTTESKTSLCIVPNQDFDVVLATTATQSRIRKNLIPMPSPKWINGSKDSLPISVFVSYKSEVNCPLSYMYNRNQNANQAYWDKIVSTQFPAKFEVNDARHRMVMSHWTC